MTEEQSTLVNIIRQTVYAYSLTLEDDDRASLYMNFKKFCNMNDWDLSQFEGDSLTSIMEGICMLAGFQEGFEASKESEQKTAQPWQRRKKGKRC